MNLLITFSSVSSALYTQKQFVKQGKRCTVIPVPRSVSSSCGYAVETEDTPLEAVKAMLDDVNIEWERIYRPVSDDENDGYRPAASWNSRDADDER